MITPNLDETYLPMSNAFSIQSTETGSSWSTIGSGSGTNGAAAGASSALVSILSKA